MIKTGKAGSGTYGTVYNAKMGKKDDNEIAVKRNIIDSDISFSGSIREMDILNRLRGHPFIVKLISVSFGNPFITPNSPLNFQKSNCKEDYLHFIFEKGEKNLHNLIYEKVIHVSYLKLAMAQILLAVEYMHAKGVMHRDIKPANLIWFVDKNNKTSLKLCDFGLSKIKTFQEPSSPGVVTCWYRAPEICLHSKKYSFSSDIWSVGCVFYEMIGRKALINTKDDDSKIISKIIGLIPEVDTKYLSKIKNLTKDSKQLLTKDSKQLLTKDSKQSFRKSWKDLLSLSNKNIQEFNKYGTTDSNYENFLDLLDKLLKLNPKERLTATEALAHPFFKSYESVILWSRTNFPPNIKSEPIISIHDCIERRWAIQIVFSNFNNREDCHWYQHRILFQSIDMFDRYLIYLSNKENFIIPSDFSGKLMTKEESELRYFVCLYMCIKYFTTLSIPISFSFLVSEKYKTESDLIKGEEFEQLMLKDVLKFKIFRETIYEASDRIDKNGKRNILDEYKIRDLIYLYGKLNSKVDITPTVLLSELLEVRVFE